MGIGTMKIVLSHKDEVHPALLAPDGECKVEFSARQCRDLVFSNEEPRSQAGLPETFRIGRLHLNEGELVVFISNGYDIVADVHFGVRDIVSPGEQFRHNGMLPGKTEIKAIGPCDWHCP